MATEKASNFLLNRSFRTAGVFSFITNYFSTQEYKFKENTFRLAHFNVPESDYMYDGIVQKAQDAQADLLSFQEVDSLLTNELTTRLKNEYLYYHNAYSTERGPTGVAVFSKYPVKDFTTYYWGGTPTLTGNVLLPDTSVHFIATHALSSRRSVVQYTKHNQHLRQIARYLENIEGAVLVTWRP
ncbi:MAG: endonuclease/exonuclease/phosphatase family protein [Tunicatimonas sp.]|uniref:endonuclease/exonuclease/phosphatase family protein n=1 Tax=Tunicatimonas sp. TaxID=1940096 RepID=UPI003C73175E